MEQNQKKGCSCSFNALGIILIIVSFFLNDSALTMRAVGLGIMVFSCLSSLFLLSFFGAVANALSPFSGIIKTGSKIISNSIMMTVGSTIFWSGWFVCCILKIKGADISTIKTLALSCGILAITLFIVGYIKNRIIIKKSAEKLMNETNEPPFSDYEEIKD